MRVVRRTMAAVSCVWVNRRARVPMVPTEPAYAQRATATSNKATTSSASVPTERPSSTALPHAPASVSTLRLKINFVLTVT